jgi:hypothetical protein
MFFNGFKSGMKGGFFDQRVQAVNNGKQEPLSITIYNALHTSVGEELKIRNVKSDLVSIKFDTYDDFKLLIMELNGDEVLESKYIIMALYKDGETSKYYTVIRTDGYADNGMVREWFADEENQFVGEVSFDLEDILEIIHEELSNSKEKFGDGFMVNGAYSVSRFIQEEKLTGRLADTTVKIGDYKTRYNKNDNTIYISAADNKTQNSFINALMRCFQQAICVETGILYSQTDMGKNDTEISDEDLFGELSAETKKFIEEQKQFKKRMAEMTDDMNEEKFFNL